MVTPVLLSFGLAFTDYDALTPPRFIALDNFGEALAEPLFWTALGNSLFFVAFAVPLRVLAALGLALLLERPRRGINAYRTSVYLPTVVPDVAYALVWLWVLNPLYGPVNLVLGGLGLPTAGWFADPDAAKPAFVLMALFQVGEGFVLLLAGLAGVPRASREAAAVDGASGWQTFRHILFPLLLPWLTLLAIRDLVIGFQWTFAPSYLITGGDPYYSTLFLPLLIYEEAFDRFRFGLGSAMTLLLLLVVGVLVGAVYLAVRHRLRAVEAM